MVGWGDGPPPPALHVPCRVRGDFDEVHECPLPPFPFPPSHDTRIRTTRRRTASSGRAGKVVLRIAFVLFISIVLVTLVIPLILVRPASPNRAGVLQSCW